MQKKNIKDVIVEQKLSLMKKNKLGEVKEQERTGKGYDFMLKQ